MSILWAGYYDVFFHTRVYEKCLYLSLYHSRQQL